MPDTTDTNQNGGSVMAIVFGVTSIITLGTTILFAFLWNKASKKLSEQNENATAPGPAAANTPPGQNNPAGSPSNNQQPPRGER